MWYLIDEVIRKFYTTHQREPNPHSLLKDSLLKERLI
jgi:hypothetical protein